MSRNKTSVEEVSKNEDKGGWFYSCWRNTYYGGQCGIPDVLGERAGCVLGGSTLKESYEINGNDSVGDCGSEEKSDDLALFRPDYFVDSSERGKVL